MSFLGSIGSAVASGLSSLGQSWLGNEIQGHYDRKLMKYQNDLMRENWEMMNAYNTPSAQMARYKEAGLNPNLIYGQANTTGSIGTPSAHSGQGVDFVGTLDTMQRIKLMSAEVANRRKQNDVMSADIANKLAQNSLLNSQADYVNEQVQGQRLENELKRLTIGSVGRGGNPNDPWYVRYAHKFSNLLYDVYSSGYRPWVQRYSNTGMFDFRPLEQKGLPPRGKLVVRGD